MAKVPYSGAGSDLDVFLNIGRAAPPNRAPVTSTVPARASASSAETKTRSTARPSFPSVRGWRPSRTQSKVLTLALALHLFDRHRLGLGWVWFRHTVAPNDLMSVE